MHHESPLHPQGLLGLGLNLELRVRCDSSSDETCLVGGRALQGVL